MTASLAGVWAKIERGHEHRDGYRVYVADFFAIETNKPHLGVKFDPKTGEHVLYVQSAPDWADFRKRTALLIGDALQNFRSALDYLVYQLAILYTNGNVQTPDAVQFPIADSKPQFMSAAFTKGRARLGEIHPDHAALIERLQPYHGRYIVRINGAVCDPLMFLRDASNADKHRLLTTVFVLTKAMGIVDPIAVHILVGPGGNIWRWANTMKVASLELGAEIARRDFGNGVLIREVDVAAVITPRVAFPEGWSAHETLDQIETTARLIISQFIDIFP